LSQELTYERALELLDQKLKALEDGDLSLDEALSAVDEARTYLRVCHDRLEEAKKRIEVRPEARPESRPEPQAGPPEEMGRLL
jgi:exodeoxyribonuclease VII small subunit